MAVGTHPPLPPELFSTPGVRPKGEIMHRHLVFAALFGTALLAVGAEALASELDRELYRELHRGPQHLSPLPELAIEIQACYHRLAKIAVFTPISAHAEPLTCSFEDLVSLDHVTMPDKTKITISPPATLRCATAEGFSHFIRDDLAPAAADFAAPLASLAGVGSFECRKRNGDGSGKLSEHAKGNAIDVGSIRLRDGKLINLTDPRAPRSFLEQIRALACLRFTTVLGPGSDASHNGHIHLDLLERRGGYRICQWTPSVIMGSVEAPIPRPRPRNNNKRP
jgi:hypothetical protein